MKTRIVESRLSDRSEVYAVRITTTDFVLHFDMSDYDAAIRFCAAFANADVVDCRIFSVTAEHHKELKPI